MTGIVEFKVLLFLDCDASEEEVEEAYDDFTEKMVNMKLKGVNIQSVEVGDETTHQ